MVRYTNWHVSEAASSTTSQMSALRFIVRKTLVDWLRKWPCILLGIDSTAVTHNAESY